VELVVADGGLGLEGGAAGGQLALWAIDFNVGAEVAATELTVLSKTVEYNSQPPAGSRPRGRHKHLIWTIPRIKIIRE